MATQAEQLAELQALNAQLGLSEDDGMPLTYEQKIAELRALDEELASTPESFGEYVERRKIEDSRSLGDKTSAFTDSFITGAGALASEGSKAIGELFSGNVGKSEIGGVFKIGMADFKRFANTLGGSAMDNFYSDEEEMKREYERYKDNFLYNQNVRTAMLNTYDEEGRDFISFGANFVDPTLLVPGAGLLTKGASLGAKAVATGAKAGAFAARSPRLVQLSRAMAKTSRGAQKVAKGLDKASDVVSIPAKLAASGTRKAIKGSALVGSKIAGGVGKAGEVTSKVASLPRAAVTGFASKFIDPKIAGSGILGAQATGALTGAVPGLGLLTGAEALGYIANKTGRGVERTLSALASTGGQKRFLQRLATSADSPRLRKLALIAHSGIGGVGATKLTDLAFNSLVNGASVGVLNGALAYASGEGAEGVGAAVGSGTLMGGSLPFGQPGMKGGKSQAARDQSSINFLNAKLADDQIKQFKKLSPEARLAFATVEEAGIPSPQLKFLDKQTYLDFLRQDDPNLRSAPNAHYGIADNTIYINQDGNAGRSSKEAMDILTHELGHHFIKQAIKDDPFFAEKILSEYKAKPGEESFDFAFTTDSAGAPIDSIKLNKKAVDIADLYGGIQDGIGIGRNAEKLAQEIGAEQFAMMMVDDPNIFNTIEPSLRQKLLDGSRKVLTMFGAVDGNTGNPLDISILGKEVRSKNPLVQRSKSIKNLYKNYVKQREYALADKIDLAENPMKIKLQRGEKPQQAVQRLFNTKGISLKEAGAFRINNRKVKEKLVEIKKRLLKNPTGGMRAFVNKSGNAIAIKGKTLSDEVRSVFTRNDPFGNINTLINVAQEAIRDKAQLNFLYRSGKPSKYSDNELRPRVVSPIGFNITGLSDRSTSAASLKLDSFDEAYLRNNSEVLVQEGFAKDPNALIMEGRRVAKESLSDSEGRINPKGKQENELVTALFGQPESAGFIKNKKLRVLLEEGRLKHAFRSYDFDALAGLVPTGRDGISFDWDNVKHNHMPFDDKLFIPAYHGTPHTLAPEPGAPLGKFRTSKIGTGEGSQAYGHGLYFAGKRDVAEHYRKNLTRKIDHTKATYDGGEYDSSNIRHQAAWRLNKVGSREMAILSYGDKFNRPGHYMPPNERQFYKDLIKVLENKEEAKLGGGSLYKVELAPKENEYLLYDKTLGEQPKGVQDKLKKFLREQEGEDTWQYRQEQDYRDITNNVLDDMPEAEISKRLKEAGIPGIKYLDGSSRSKGEGDFNYVIFDEADVTVTDKLFMPASEAGAGKGNQAEAAKLWNEKGIESPYFKKWFGKSAIRDESGNPMIMYHGTLDKFTDFNRGSHFGTKKAATERIQDKQIQTNTDNSGEIKPVYLKIEKPLEMVDLFVEPGFENYWKNYEAEGYGKDASNLEREGVRLSKKYDNLKNKENLEWTEFLSSEGYDGVIYENLAEDAGSLSFIAFSPEQIKSATGNRGTFDAGERNILFMPTQGDTTPASVQSWDGPNPTFGTNFTRGMVKDNKEAAALLRKSYEDEFGQPIKAQDFTDEQVNWLGDTLAQEGEAALGRTGNAVNWYTSAVEKALSVAEEIFPDIGQKFEAKDRFLGALSITSQNMRVMDNAKAAVKQYQHKEKTGKFDYSIKHGAKADAITSNLKLYDEVEAKMGVDRLNDFLDKDFTVKELIEWGRDFFGDKKFSIAGYSTDKVKGSAIFGPKIGQGFFQNLRGNYDPVTVDLWLRRTYGRLTGLSLDTALTAKDVGRLIYAVRNNKGKRKFADLKMPDFLKGISISGKVQKNGVANYKISDKAFETLLGDHTTGRDNYDAVYKFAEKLNREWERNFAKANNDVTKAKDAVKKAKRDKRGTANLKKQLAKFEAEKVAIGKEKPQWAKAGSTVSDKLKPIDIPSNAERAVITKAFNVALKSLKDKGIDLTPADLQATLWYPEKDIWAYLKGENSDALNMSYDTAMEVIRDQR